MNAIHVHIIFENKRHSVSIKNYSNFQGYNYAYIYIYIYSDIRFKISIHVFRSFFCPSILRHQENSLCEHDESEVTFDVPINRMHRGIGMEVGFFLPKKELELSKSLILFYAMFIFFVSYTIISN